MRLVNHHYDMNKINIAFLIAGVMLLGTWVWAIYDDYAKPYKSYQRKYYDVYTKQLKLEKKDVWTEDKRQELSKRKQELQSLRQSMTQRRSEIKQLQKEVERLETVVLKKINTRVQTINSKLKPVEYQYQQELVKEEDRDNYTMPESLRQKYNRLKKQYDRAQTKLEETQETRDTKKAEIEKKKDKITRIKSQIREIQSERNLLQSEIERVGDRPINQILDAPIINFINPRVSIKQYQVGGMYMNYNFDLVNRRDYCKSCHMGIDNPSFKLNDDGEFQNEQTKKAFEEYFPDKDRRERYKRVFKTHPRFDLIGPSNAKYPFSKYGCTGCHMGDGRALSFNRAAHTPDNEKERKRWKETYGWHKREYWEYPMLKSHLYEASYGQFYPNGTRVDVPDAPRLSEGKELFRKYGCNNCHAVEGMNYQRKIGFSLEHIKSKLDPDWVRRWVEKPTDFYPSTMMPQVFHKTNMSSPKHRELSTVVIDSITNYLFKQSEPIDLKSPPQVRGDVERGQQTFKEVGCTGCHSMMDEGITANKGASAPDLSKVGTKVNRKWLYNWLRNPSKIWSKTHMPNMRLSSEEANNITEYLLTKKAESWSADDFPKEAPDGSTLSGIIDNRLESTAKKFIGRTRKPKATKQKFQEIVNSAGPSKSEKQKALKMYIGEQAVDFYGCTSCHAVPGHEGKNRIGAELTTWANKSVHKLAFNYIHIPHRRQDYIMTKLRETGIFDRGLTKSYLEKYRMPKPNLTEEQRRKVTTYVMSLRSDRLVEPDYEFQPSPAQEFTYESRKLITKYNCEGCHTLDEESPMSDYLVNYYEQQLQDGGDFALGNNTDPTARQMAQAHVPPSLTNVGLRLQEDWMFKFLKKPRGPGGRDQIRTWQHVRMPNFHLSDEEASTLSQGLAYEGWDKLPPKISPEARTTTPETLRVGEAIFKRVCSNCHIAQGDKTFKAPQMTPNLSYTGDKFHYTGFLEWIEKPTEKFVPDNTGIYRHQGMVPYSQVPATESFLGFEPEGDYSSKEKQMKALRDYLFYREYKPK